MDRLKGLVKQLRTLLRKRHVEEELDEEVRFHLEMEAKRLRREEGLSEREAWRRARLAFGGVERFKEEVRDARWTRPLEDLAQDLRYAGRELRRSPGFTLVAVLTLALGIGANTAIFSLLDAVLLRPLPLEHPERVVQIRDHLPETDWDQLSVPNYDDYRREGADLFRHFAALQGTPLFVEGPDGAREARGLYASADLFRMLDVRPLAGRFFSADENEGALEHVAILSHDFAQRHFGGSEAAVGRTLTIEYWSSGARDGQPRGFHGETFTVIGVLPPEFELPPVVRRGDFHTYRPEILIPMGLWSWGLGNRGQYAFPALAELRAGVPLEEARARLETVAARIADEHPDSNAGYRVSLTPLPELLAARYRSTFLLLGGSVGLVLLLACLNVATLLLSRSTVRRTEFAVRAALGAGRRRLARQVLTENALLASLGGAASLLVAYGTGRLLVALMPAEIPRLQHAAIDLRAVAFTFGIAALTVMLFGSLPALRAGRGPFPEHLKEGGRGSAGGPRRTLQGLQIVEVALAVVLLVAAGLLAHSLLRMNRVDLGVRTNGVLAVELELPPPDLSKHREEREVRRLWERIGARLQGVPGIEWAEWISAPPLNGSRLDSEVTLADPQRPGTHSTADWRLVSPGFLRRAGIALRAGRYFEEGDERRPVVIVDETLASKFWPDGEAVGGQIYYGRQDLSAGPFPHELDELLLAQTEGERLDPAERQRLRELRERIGDRVDRRYPAPIRLTVVGVADNVDHMGPGTEPTPQYYMTLHTRRSVSFLMGTAADPGGLAPSVEAAIREVDRVEPAIASVRTLQDYAAATMAQPRFQTMLVGAFALVALLLVTVGLYGVVSYSVGRRIREMGVRQALGARSADILRLVLGQGIGIALWGLVPGVLAGLAVSRFLESLLFEIRPTDPWTYAAVCLLVLLVTALASYVPARRAVRADPVEALRAE